MSAQEKKTDTCLQWHWSTPTADQSLICQRTNEAHW